jgi:Tfp pilus assembly protein PilX
MDAATIKAVVASLAALLVVSILIVHAWRDVDRRSRASSEQLKADAAWWDAWAARRAAERKARKAGDDCQAPR